MKKIIFASLLIKIVLLSSNLFAQQKPYRLNEIQISTSSAVSNFKTMNTNSDLATVLKTDVNLQKFDRTKLLKFSRGNEGGHGGDPYASEFYILGKICAASLAESNQEILKTLSADGESFLKTVNQSRIVSANSEDMILNGYEVGAINFPSSQIIKVNSKIWKRLNLDQKIQLVLHEYLGLMSIELDTYNISSNLRKWTHELSEYIANEPQFKNLNVNMFFGNCSAAVPLQQASTCDASSVNYAKALTCAQAQAETLCRSSGQKSCEQISLVATEFIDSKLIGLRQCIIEVIMK